MFLKIYTPVNKSGALNLMLKEYLISCMNSCVCCIKQLAKILILTPNVAVGLVMIIVKIQRTFVISIHSIFNFYLKN